MISVRNHQLRLSGSSFYLVLCFSLLLFVTSCGVKQSTVLKSPDYRESTTQPPKVIEKTEEVVEEVEVEIANKIALLLPFKLQHIRANSIGNNDVKRSAIALDFYQGVQLGLEDLAKKGERFVLDVLDSEDDIAKNRALAQAIQVQDASIVIGPVFPNEIKAFGSSLGNKEVLQVNPLAATMPSEFMNPNLVSLTPSIQSHARAIAKKIVQDHRTGDKVFLLNIDEQASKQFLSAVEVELQNIRSDISIQSVADVRELSEYIVNETGSNQIVCGTTNKFILSMLMSALELKYTEEQAKIRLYGHPLWDRVDFNSYSLFEEYNPIITSDSHLNERSAACRKFKEIYNTSFGVDPSDHAYKGYDAAMFFGELLKKYGENYRDKLLSANFKGIYSHFRFTYNNNWGFENEAVSYRLFKNGSFQLN